MSEQHGAAQPDESVVGSERAKAFVDAVVAIAMTLLILPLMESVEHTRAPDTATWLAGHRWELLAFLLSFSLTAVFWVQHHRMFAAVTHVSPALLWLGMAWLLTIVWLPVATALSGEMPYSDAVVKCVYVGTMATASLLALAQWRYLRAHPTLHRIGAERLRRGSAVSLAMAVLFVVSLVVAVTVPAIGYFALLAMFLTRPLERLLLRRRVR